MMPTGMRGVLSLQCPQSSQLEEGEEGEEEVKVELGPPLEVVQVLLQEHLRTQAKNKKIIKTNLTSNSNIFYNHIFIISELKLI